VLDASDSMAGRPIASAMAAMRAFAQRRVASQQLGIVTFNSTASVRLPLTTNARRIDSVLARTPTLAYGTHIYDSVLTAVRMLDKARVASGTIVLLSDGADTGSSASIDRAVSAAQDAHVRIFTIGLRSGVFDGSSLTGLASQTGGTFAAADSPAALNQVYSVLGERLSGEYLLQYRSLAGPDRPIKVVVAIGGATAAAPAYRTPPLPALSGGPFHESSTDRLWRSTGLMVVVALLVALLIAGSLSWIIRTPSSGLQRRMAEFVSLYSPRQDGTPLRAPDALPPGQGGSREGSSRWRRFTESLAIADINLSPTQIVIGTVLGTILATVLCVTLFGSPIFGIFGLLVPLFVHNSIKAKLTRKRRLFGEQLPDTLQIVASALRAGHTIVGALAVVSSESPEPTRGEIQRVVADEQLGVPLETALERVAARMASREFEQVAIVAGLQREAGGNAAEVLDRVGENVREGIELRQLVRSLTAQGRLSRWVLTLLPLGLALVIAILDPGYLSPLIDKPLGRAILVAAGIMIVIGSLLIKRIVEIKV
jgi:tight adherence protein B